jgi:hypothetical protein
MIHRFVRMIFADLGETKTAVADHPVDWEKRSLIQSIRRVSLVFVAVWQLPMMLATFGTLGSAGWPLALAQLCLAVGALLALRFRGYDLMIPIGMAAVGLSGYLTSADIDSALVVAACWQINFSSCVVGLIVLRPYALPLVIASAVSTALWLIWVRPEWGIQFPLVIIVTQFSIIAALKWGIGGLIGVAAAADNSAAVAADADRRGRLAEHLSAQLAEESRVLHDTAINTLGAIANGGAGTVDVERVRQQCARDVTMLTNLRTHASFPTTSTLQEIFEQSRLPLRRSGADDDELTDCEKLLPPSTVTAIVRCAQEAMTNAAKHSGAFEAEVAIIRSETTLTVMVRDAGVGFAADSATAGHGIRASIVERARDNGFHATIDSRPGFGTAVTLTVPLVSGTAEGGQAVPEEKTLLAEELPLRAGELWGIGVTVVSAILAVAGGSNQHLALYPMISIMLIVWAVYRFAPRLRTRHSFIIPLSLSTGVVFFLSAAATEFGTIGAIHWQALAPTGPFVLLLSLVQNRWVRALTAAYWVAIIVWIAASVYPTSTAAAQIVLVTGCVGLGFASVWTAFQTVLLRLSRQAARSRRDAITSNLRASLEVATQNGYRRWVGAGLDSAIGLLREIAQHQRHPRSKQTRNSCADEERYLRQIIQISPQLVHLSAELPQTLNLARRNDVVYHLRLGDSDAPDATTARQIASSIHDVLTNLTPGAMLQASLFPVTDGLQLTLLGPGIGRLVTNRDGAHRVRVGQLDLVELAYPQIRTEALRA